MNGFSPARPLTLAIKVYRKSVSPFLKPRCRFSPSCSEYAEMAIGLHGAWRGTVLSLARLVRCHPFNPGGIDPVPRVYPFRYKSRRGTSAQ